jgi:hypothetical protein
MENFKAMYDCTYERMVEAGVAKKLDEPVWMDREGNIVETQGEAYG